MNEWMNGILLLYISINILAAFCGIPEAKLTYNQPTYFRGKPRERTDSWQTEFSTACKPIIETVRSWRHCNRRKSDPCLCFSMYHIFAGTWRVRDEDKVSWSRSIVQSSCPLPLFPRPDRSKYRHLITLLRTVIHWPGFFFSFSLGYESQICYSNGKRFVELSFTNLASTCCTFLCVVVLITALPALRHEYRKTIVCLEKTE